MNFSTKLYGEHKKHYSFNTLITMSQYKTFEELSVWQKAHEAALLTYKLTKDQRFCKDFALIDQMRRAAISITSNIAEGHERRSDKEFGVFLNYAKASSSELRSQFILAKDLEYVTLPQFEEVKQQLIEVNWMLASLMKYLSK
jgi:four helix bundle protein